MKKDMPITISFLQDMGKCDELFALYRTQSGTLGFLPRGAFEESIMKQRVIIASDDSGALIGYLLFRVTDQKAIITHLCVSTALRQRGVATALLTKLKQETTSLDGIKLKCRRDYIASRLWPKVGLVAKGSAVGRGADAAELVVWHLDHCPNDLLSAPPSSKTLVAIDANVFVDLTLVDRANADVSGALTEDWLDELIELVVTSEIYNDINRCPDPTLRQSSKGRVTGFHEIRGPVVDVDRKVNELKRLYAGQAQISESDISDIKHLAYASVAGVRYFVTRDEKLLAKAPDILSRHDVHVMTPVELVLSLDRIEREQEYQPQRLAASSFSTKRLDAANIDTALEQFRVHPHERVNEFRDLLHSSLTDSREHNVHVASNASGYMAALLAWKRDESGEIRVSLLRQSSEAMAPTVLRHMLMKRIIDAAKEKCVSIRIVESRLIPKVLLALSELGFINTGSGWVKPLLHGFWTIHQIAEKLTRFGITISKTSQPNGLSTIIWPGKLQAEAIKYYIVPIQAQWAEHFFDVELASQRLPMVSGIKEDLHLGVEGIYYSASKVRLEAPAHILWYVSEGNEGLGSMQIKATSCLREVVHDSAKSLFGRFRRLGVYEWRDLMATAKQNKAAELMALRFSHTELFPRPVDLANLPSFGIKAHFMGPRQITAVQFEQIYRFAFNH